MSKDMLFQVKHLSAWYTKDNKVLEDFNIELGKHEVVGLIGLNGAGKTTFMKTVAGLLSTYQIEEAVFAGKQIGFRDNAFKKKRYAVFAEEHSFQYFTFKEYINYVADSYGKELTGLEQLIQGFRFEEYTDVLLKELSTGNLKKAYLITAFALKPELLLLDEPVNGLDFQSTEYLYQLMEEYKNHGTLLFSSHILESISLTSDRVLVLENGQIKKVFEKEEIIAQNIREALSKDESI